jgi:hypothetical protein
MGNWFLAARQGNVLAREFYRVTFEFFRDNPFPDQRTALRQFWMRRLAPRLNANRRTTRDWFWWPVRHVLRIYPYFVNHYLFDRLIESDATCRAIWEGGSPMTLTGAIFVRDRAAEPNGFAQSSAHISRGEAVMHKLDWRIDPSSEYWTGILSLLHQRLGA